MACPHLLPTCSSQQVQLVFTKIAYNTDAIRTYYLHTTFLFLNDAQARLFAEKNWRRIQSAQQLLAACGVRN